MNISRHIYRLLPALAGMAMLTACQEDLLTDGPSLTEGGITFLISAPVEEETWLTRAAGEDEAPETLKSLRYLIADGRGNVLDHHYGRLSADLDRLNVDGLQPGDYSLLLLGSSDESDLAEIGAPAHVDDAWLSNIAPEAPMEGSYFFKRVDFNVDLKPEAMTVPVVLERPMARVVLEIPELPAVVEDMISSVAVTLDDDCLYGAVNAGGAYTGSATMKGYEVRDSLFMLTFTTLPSARPVSGKVTVKAATIPGDSLTTEYRFENLSFEPGKQAKISLNLNHPDMSTGFKLIRPRDYFDYDADIMLMEDEPLSVLHDSQHRRFPVCKPLQVTSWDNQMRVRLFLAAPVDDVDIYANFPSLGLDSVKIAHFDRVEPLLDMLVPMPFLEKECKYYDIHGKRVTIPRLGSLPATVEWIYKTPDAYLDQLSKLKYQRWAAWCPSYETYWARYAITPTNDIIRHGFMICQCMAIMFDSEEFYSEMEANEGTFINGTTYLTNEDILRRVYNFAGFGWGSCNPASGAVGWGGGSTMIFMASYYRGGMYPGTATNSPNAWPRVTLYHEFGHCLGFGHDGNMTYGGKWTGVCNAAYIKCYLNGKIPYGLPDYVYSVPYKRADAPKWARPRFVAAPPVEPEDPGEVPGEEPGGEETRSVKGKRSFIEETGIAEPIS